MALEVAVTAHKSVDQSCIDRKGKHRRDEEGDLQDPLRLLLCPSCVEQIEDRYAAKHRLPGKIRAITHRIAALPDGEQNDRRGDDAEREQKEKRHASLALIHGAPGTNHSKITEHRGRTPEESSRIVGGQKIVAVGAERGIIGKDVRKIRLDLREGQKEIVKADGHKIGMVLRAGKIVDGE